MGGNKAGSLRLAAVLGALGVMVAGGRAQQIQVSGNNRTIQVTATDSAERRADAAVLHLGYQEYGASSAEAYGKGAAVSKDVVAAITEAGVAGDAIESTAQSTGAVENYANSGLPVEEAAQRRFTAQQGWSVRVAPGAVARVLAAAVGAGANQSGAVDWSVVDGESLGAEAAAKALRHARLIAEQMAAGLDAKLGPLEYASNQAEGGGPVRMMVDGPAPVVNAAPRKLVPELRLSPPMERVAATVTAVFSIQ